MLELSPTRLAYDLVVADIDGTLLDDSHLVAPGARAAVACAAEAGVRLTLATGRVLSSAVQVAKELGLSEPLITDGGAVVSYPAGEILRELRLDPDVAAAVLARVAGLDADCHVFYHDGVLVNRLSPDVERYADRLRIPMTPVADLVADARRRMVGPTMIVLRTGVAAAARVRAEYAAAFGAEAQVTSTAPHFVDFMAKGASKASALEYLCGHLGIDPARVIAIGDGINDLDMLARAGLGVMVANAAPELWAHAGYVTRAPYYDGVAEVIRRFCGK